MSLKPRFGTHSADDLASMEPMKLLQIQVSRSNSLESRIEGLKKVTLVASVLSASGKNRVRKELMPWLKTEFLVAFLRLALCALTTWHLCACVLFSSLPSERKCGTTASCRMRGRRGARSCSQACSVKL